jgi:hypothetical protein
MNSKQARKSERPVDDNEETFDKAFDSLVEDGLIVPTGELRRGSDGRLYPVYVADIYAEHYTTASAIAEKKKQRIC